MKNLLLVLFPVLLAMSVPSANIFAQTCTAPAPGNFMSSPISNTSTALSWNPVAAYTTYRLTVLNSTTGVTVLNNVLVNGASRVVSGLNTNDTYTATVKVQCSPGSVSPNAATLTFEVCQLPAPLNFQGVTFNGATGPGIEWTWEAVPGAVEYVLTVTDVTTGTVEVINTTTTAATTAAIVGHTYSATVGGVCGNGEASPNFAVAKVDWLIVDDIVQLVAPGCGMEDNNCPLPTPAGYNLLSTMSNVFPMTINFAAGESRRVLKFKVIESNTLAATSPFIEFKLAFEPGSNTVYFRSGAASVNYSTILGVGPSVEVKKYAVTQGIFQLSGYSAIGSTTTFNLAIVKNSVTKWKFNHWLCKSCIANPMTDSDDDFEAIEIPVETSTKRSSGIPTEITLNSFPNPAKESVLLRFELPTEQNATLLMYDAAGQLVREFFLDEWHEAGTHEFEPELKNLAPGVYNCVLSSGEEIARCQLVKI